MFVSVCASLFLLSVSNCSFCHILCCACSPWGSNLVGAEVFAPHLHFVLVYFADQLFGEDDTYFSGFMLDSKKRFMFWSSPWGFLCLSYDICTSLPQRVGRSGSRTKCMNYHGLHVCMLNDVGRLWYWTCGVCPVVNDCQSTHSSLLSRIWRQLPGFYFGCVVTGPMITKNMTSIYPKLSCGLNLIFSMRPFASVLF